MRHVGINELTLITVVFRFSYLHSQRGQNSCSLPLILSAYLARITESQSLEDMKLNRMFWNFLWNFSELTILTTNQHLQSQESCCCPLVCCSLPNLCSDKCICSEYRRNFEPTTKEQCKNCNCDRFDVATSRNSPLTLLRTSRL